MLSTGSNRFERWQGNSDIIAFACIQDTLSSRAALGLPAASREQRYLAYNSFAFLFDAIICRIKIHFFVIMTSSDSVSISVISQDG